MKQPSVPVLVLAALFSLPGCSKTAQPAQPPSAAIPEPHSPDYPRFQSVGGPAQVALDTKTGLLCTTYEKADAGRGDQTDWIMEIEKQKLKKENH
jgi:hypothetical protein